MKNYKIIKFQNKGFTLIELLVVIAITTILGGIGLSSYVNQQRSKLLQFTTQEIVGYLRYAQQKSITQESGNQWGVHFENPASGNDFYSLYTGTSYSSPQETRYLPNGLEFQLPLSGNTVDISFSKLTGQNYTDTEQEVIINLTGSQTARVIRTMPNGVMTSGGGEKGYWKFDEGVGNSVADETIYKNTGTLYNSPTWKVSSNCISGTCLEFDGTDDYVVVADAVSLNFGTGEFTVLLWAKSNQLLGARSYYKKRVGTSWTNGKGIELNSGNGAGDVSLYWIIGNGTTHVEITPQGWTKANDVFDWIQVGIMRDSNNNIYRVLNGVKEDSGKDLSGDVSNVENLTFGGGGVSGAGTINGFIDQVRIYNRALSASEILQHYKARE